MYGVVFLATPHRLAEEEEVSEIMIIQVILMEY